jgi:hypothetical protein
MMETNMEIQKLICTNQHHNADTDGHCIVCGVMQETQIDQELFPIQGSGETYALLERKQHGKRISYYIFRCHYAWSIGDEIVSVVRVDGNDFYILEVATALRSIGVPEDKIVNWQVPF